MSAAAVPEVTTKGVSSRTVLAVGKVDRHTLAQLGLSGHRQIHVEFTRAARNAASPVYDVVVADGRFDVYSYLDFATELAQVRDLVAVGGSLYFVRPAGREKHDEFFCYRTDEFFRDELAQVGVADFEEVASEEKSGTLIVRMSNRLPSAESTSRLAALPHKSLARLPLFARDFRRPGIIWMATTTRCNIRCRTCSIRNNPTPGNDMPETLIDDIFDQLGDDIFCVNVTGIGEALFSRNFKHLYARIRSKPGRLMEMVTNSILLKEEHVRDMMKPENPTYLVVSIDGATKETFEYVRDRAKWDRVTATMDMIRRVREEMKPGDHFRLAVDFVALKDNVRELPQFVELCAGWKVDWLIVIEMGDWETNRDFFLGQALRFRPKLANEWYGKAREEAKKYTNFSLVSIPPDYSPDIIAQMEHIEAAEAGGESATHILEGAEKDAKVATEAAAVEPKVPLSRRTLRAAKRAVKDKPWVRKVGRRVLTATEHFVRHPKWLPKSVSNSLRRQTALMDYPAIGQFKRVRGYCEVVDQRTYFHANGDVVPCCGMLGTKFGNILERPFDEIWNSAEYREFRIMNLLGYPFEPCFYCTLGYGLPEKNPENFIAAHRLPPTRLPVAWFLRKAREALAERSEPKAPEAPHSPKAADKAVPADKAESGGGVAVAAEA